MLHKRTDLEFEIDNYNLDFDHLPPIKQPKEDLYSTLVSVTKNPTLPNLYEIVEQDKAKGIRTTTLDLANNKTIAETRRII
jgi:hypothetical protein